MKSSLLLLILSFFIIHVKLILSPQMRQEIIDYFDKALSCDRDDRDTIKLYAKVLTGQFGEEFVDYRYAQALIDSLPLKYMDDKSFYALLGDAYFGETKKNYFKASRLYDNYPEIDSYKSKIRSNFCMMRNVILIAVLMIIFGTIAIMALT